MLYTQIEYYKEVHFNMMDYFLLSIIWSCEDKMKKVSQSCFHSVHSLDQIFVLGLLLSKDFNTWGPWAGWSRI